MKKTIFSGLFIALLVAVFACLLTAGQPFASEDTVSGEIIGGYRVIAVSATEMNLSITVYRGDYVKLKLVSSSSDKTLSIPALSVEKSIPDDFDNAPYFKAKTVGKFPFTLGNARGELTVIEFHKPEYREVTAKEASELIKNIDPLILDVRTPGEYKRGHLKDALLIPIQKLQKRIAEIEKYKDDPILVYCATGNRSTVASKILIDRGFKRIYNLIDGFYGWANKGYPFER
jgi:rhodanese-related sulfurtransferase